MAENKFLFKALYFLKPKNQFNGSILYLIKNKFIFNWLGFVSLQVSFLTGLPASKQINILTIIHAVNISIAIITMISVYFFNKNYLKNRVVEINQPASPTVKNIVGFKTLIFGALPVFLLSVSLIIFQSLDSIKGTKFPYGPFFTSLVLTFIVFYFSMKSYVREYSALQFKKRLEGFQLQFHQYKERIWNK